jgi:hypothetical protein
MPTLAQLDTLITNAYFRMLAARGLSNDQVERDQRKIIDRLLDERLALMED